MYWRWKIEDREQSIAPFVPTIDQTIGIVPRARQEDVLDISVLVATPSRATLERQWQSDDNDDSVYSSFFDTTQNNNKTRRLEECNKAINNELLLIFLLQKRICRGRVCCWGRSNGRCLFVVHPRKPYLFPSQNRLSSTTNCCCIYPLPETHLPWTSYCYRQMARP